MARASLNLLIVCGFVAAGIFAGCATALPLEKRVSAYWQAREARDFGASYELEDPRSGIDKAQYLATMAAGNVEYRSFKIQEVHQEGDKANVVLKIVYRIPMVPKNAEGSLTEEWTRVGRHWYHKNPLTER